MRKPKLRLTDRSSLWWEMPLCHPLAPPLFHLSTSCTWTWLFSADGSEAEPPCLWNRLRPSGKACTEGVDHGDNQATFSKPLMPFLWPVVTATHRPRNCWRKKSHGFSHSPCCTSLSFAYFEAILLQPNLWKDVWKLDFLFKMFCPIKTFVTFSIKFHQWGNITW